MSANQSHGNRPRTWRFVIAGIGAALLAVGGYRLVRKEPAPSPSSDEPAANEAVVEAPAPPAAAPNMPPPPPVEAPAPPSPAAPSATPLPGEPGSGRFGMRSPRPAFAVQQAAGRMGDALLMARLRETAKTDPARAIELGRASNLRYPQSPFAGERASIVVRALVSQGETAKAREEAEQAVNRYPDGPWAREIEQLTGVRRSAAASPPAHAPAQTPP